MESYVVCEAGWQEWGHSGALDDIRTHGSGWTGDSHAALWRLLAWTSQHSNTLQTLSWSRLGQAGLVMNGNTAWLVLCNDALEYTKGSATRWFMGIFCLWFYQKTLGSFRNGFPYSHASLAGGKRRICYKHQHLYCTWNLNSLCSNWVPRTAMYKK